MTLPFEPRPGDPDADHLNTLLDASRSGTRAPDATSAASSEAARLAGTVTRFRGLVHRADAPAAAYLADHPLHERWEDIVSTAFPVTPSSSATFGDIPPPTPVSLRARKMATPPPSNRLNTWLSVAIVALMLLGTVGGAWWFGPGKGGPAGDEGIRLAAVTQDEATPEAASDWTTFTRPEECNPREIYTDEQIADLTSTPQSWPDREYGPFREPSSTDAEAVVHTMRGFVACSLTSEGLSAYFSDRFIANLSRPDVPGAAWSFDLNIEASEEVSTAWADVPPSDFFTIVDEPIPIVTPVPGVLSAEGTLRMAFHQRHVVQLADGRLAVPMSGIYVVDDPVLRGVDVANAPFWFSMIHILVEEDGELRIDEILPFCVGECDSFWAQQDSLVTPVASPVATPQARSEAPAPIMDLLSAVPAEMTGMAEGPLRSWAYADIEQRFAELGLTPEVIAEDRLLPLGMNAFGPLVWTMGLFTFAADDELVAAIGFDPYRTQQVLVAGGEPDMLTLLRGDWDTASLPAAWEAAGYTEHTTDSGLTIWSLGPNGEIDPAHPIQSKMFQQLNNVAILDGGILAFAGTMETVELAAATQAGESESARDDADIAPLLATIPENTISLVALDQPGTTLYDLEAMTQNPNIRPEDLEKIEAPFVESRGAVGPMPEYHGALFGLTSDSGSASPASATPATDGEGSSGGVIVRLGAGSDEDAAQIATVIEWRWENFLMQRTPRPFTTAMDLTEATTNGTTVVLNFEPRTTPSAWINLLISGDLAPFAVDSDE